MSGAGEELRARLAAALEAEDVAAGMECVREMYSAGGNGDWELVAPLFDPEIIWEPPHDAPTAGVYRGLEGVVKEVERWTEPFEDFRWEPTELMFNGDKVLVAGQMSGRGRGSGVEVGVEELHVITMRDGRILRLQMFLDRGAALEAAGLER